MKKLNMVMATVLVAMVAYSAYGQSTVTSFAVPALVDQINVIVAAAETRLDYIEETVAVGPAVIGSVATTTNTVTITSKDSKGVTLAERRLVRVWVSEAAFGVPSTNNIESVTLSGGTAIETVTAAADYIYLTADTGIASAVVVGTAAGTNYIQVADGGYVTSAAVVFE